MKVGNIVYISGQIPLDPDTMEVCSQDFATQAKQVFENLKAVAEASGITVSTRYHNHTVHTVCMSCVHCFIINCVLLYDGHAVYTVF